MRLRQSTERTEDRSGSWLDRVRGGSEDRARDAPSRGRSEDESTSRFGRARAKYGLGALMVAAGVVLFLIPEPVTSTAGVALIVLGALVWLVSWLR